MTPCMQRKQHVGEHWVGVIFFACVWGGALDLTNASNDPIACRSFWACELGTSRGGAKISPP
jgi:hypothetical protein